ncbi:hypothetical protein BJV78DRAFT_922791 [Lactifluus subvellereus]|nr:hypothetical protein BJV78DRAFT_922791 [Lactifluus subvellereus]
MRNALIMLAFMTFGRALLQVLVEYFSSNRPPAFFLLTVLCGTMTYPRCTNSSPNDLDLGSDCGSTGWAYTLFISEHSEHVVHLCEHVHCHIASSRLCPAERGVAPPRTRRWVHPRLLYAHDPLYLLLVP